MTRLPLIALATACLTLAPLSLLPGADALRCDEKQQEVVGVGGDKVTVYRYYETSWGSCPPDATCMAPILRPGTTPTHVPIPEVRILGETIVPQTTVPLPSQPTPGVDGPRPFGCTYGVSYDVSGQHNELGTDRCYAGPGSSHLQTVHRAVCDVYYILL